MNNYKLLENRPELTIEQIAQGMDFSKIKSNAILTKTALLKSIIIKGILGIIVISSGVVLYENYKPSVPEKKQIFIADNAKTIEPTDSNAVIETNKTIKATSDHLKIKTDDNTIKSITVSHDTAAKKNKKISQEVKSESTRSKPKKYYREDYTSSLLHKKNGVFVIYKGVKQSFTLDIIADSIKGDAKPYLMTVNNKILKLYTSQSFHDQPDRTASFDNLDEEHEKLSLIGNMNGIKILWHNSKDLDKNYEFIYINGKLFMFWACEMPKGNKTIEKQYYLETIIFDEVLTLNVPVMKGKQDKRTTSKDHIKNFLTTIGKTLTLHNYPLDIQKLKNELKKND